MAKKLNEAILIKLINDNFKLVKKYQRLTASLERRLKKFGWRRTVFFKRFRRAEELKQKYVYMTEAYSYRVDKFLLDLKDNRYSMMDH